MTCLSTIRYVSKLDRFTAIYSLKHYLRQDPIFLLKNALNKLSLYSD